VREYFSQACRNREPAGFRQPSQLGPRWFSQRGACGRIGHVPIRQQLRVALIAESVGSSCVDRQQRSEDVLTKIADETEPDGDRLSFAAGHSRSEMAAKLDFAATCPKFSRCGAAYCPAMGPTFGARHCAGERVCSYLLESVKPGGGQRVRGSLSNDLADAIIKDGLRLLNSTGPLKRALGRATRQGSRIESIKRASRSREVSI